MKGLQQIRFLNSTAWNKSDWICTIILLPNFMKAYNIGTRSCILTFDK